MAASTRNDFLFETADGMPVLGIDRLELLALHAHPVTGGDKFDAIDVELLQEGADVYHIAFLALLAENLADVLAAVRPVVADRAACAHLAAEIERRRVVQLDHVAVAADVAHGTSLAALVLMALSPSGGGRCWRSKRWRHPAARRRRRWSRSCWPPPSDLETPGPSASRYRRNRW